MEIRSYQAADADALSAIYNDAYPDNRHSSRLFHGRMRHLLANEGFVRVLLVNGEPAGFAAASPVPGLQRVMSLELVVHGTKRRQGLGSQLLQHLLSALKEAGVGQLSYSVTDLTAPAAQFLQARQFFVEHQEWLMERANLDALPHLPDVDLQRFPRAEAINLFCDLYDRSFADFPWYQPYSSAEVEATLDSPADLLFLAKNRSPIGFIWTRWAGEGVGEIEPIGVVKEYQGQGHGHALLLAGLHRLKRLGAEQARVGVWKDNATAIHLYRSLGFLPIQTFTYLALDLQSP
jgi:mycothiol synthase